MFRGGNLNGRQVFCHEKWDKACATDDCGMKIPVQWTNGSRQWIDLKILKESNPVQVAEYAMACNIGDEPVFAW